jgi:hypothetical protein
MVPATALEIIDAMDPRVGPYIASALRVAEIVLEQLKVFERPRKRSVRLANAHR